MTQVANSSDNSANNAEHLILDSFKTVLLVKEIVWVRLGMDR